MVPADWLSCTEEPRVPSMVNTDTELAQWAESTRLAGADCRAKILSLRDLVATWPK